MQFLKFRLFASYVLAMKTAFFGKKFNDDWNDLYDDENFSYGTINR